MGKRSDFKRRERDFYPTPYEAVIPLLPHIDHIESFAEPCCGDGSLIQHLRRHGIVNFWMSDISPRTTCDMTMDALEFDTDCVECDAIITNPPWDRKILHPLIEHLSAVAPTWLLFDADWMHTKQSEPYMKWCRKIVSVGRVKWIPDSKMTGKDNCAWYLFDQQSEGATEFIGRILVESEI